MSQSTVRPPSAEGALGVLIPGLGAVASTFIAGVHALRRGLGEPVGSLTQLGRFHPSHGEPLAGRRISEVLPLASVADLRFGGWDVRDESCLDAARRAAVLDRSLIDSIAEDLKGTRALPGVFDREYVKRLEGTHVKRGRSKMELAEALRQDIRDLRSRLGVKRAVMIWCGSTEVHLVPGAVHEDPDAFERGLEENHPAIAPSMIYAYAAIKEGLPYCNGAPNLSADIPALVQLAAERGVPTAGKDLKTGQTMVKTALGPMLRSRMLGLRGWYSTNILGNRDGEVLDDPGSFRTKEVTKLGVLDSVLDPVSFPELYSEVFHKVCINYYPPRGDEKEGWDNVDLFGWLGYPMQIKVNFLCRDSILAAPLVLDLALLLDLAGRVGLSGPQEWLSFFFKNPLVRAGRKPEHALFLQEQRFYAALAELTRGERAQASALE